LSSISSETVKNAATCGLSAAATKSKLFADQEEREIQRLAATIINHQVCCNTKIEHVALLL
jgi:SWI/SNF related-matrix-associated actin-dependent regulator of chromatin subfamily C